MLVVAATLVFRHSSHDTTLAPPPTTLRPYYNDVVKIISHIDEMRSLNPASCSQYDNVTTLPSLDFVHVPIVDCSVTDDKTIIKLCKDLVRRIAAGEIVYLHCWGGHGRTGTVICIMLVRVVLAAAQLAWHDATPLLFAFAFEFLSLLPFSLYFCGPKQHHSSQSMPLLLSRAHSTSCTT